MRHLVLMALVLPAVFAPPAAATPRVHQLVVFRDGKARSANPSLAGATAKLGRKHCAVAGGTPLAALIRSGIGPLSLKDFGSCSKRTADAASLFVRAIGSDRNRGSDGWVYKSGNVLGTAGAGDPAGPLGHGRLRPGAHVTWFWCHVTAADNGCPHTLAVAVSGGAGTITVRVRQYDDHGKGKPAVGATVHAGSHVATTGADGVAHLAAPAGRYTVFAKQKGRIRSFATTVAVK